MRINMGYPAAKEELQILETRGNTHQRQQSSACTGETILEMQKAVAEIRVDSAVSDYLLKIVARTRESRDLELGASPRATLSLFQASQAWAAIQGRDFVMPDDVKVMAPHVLTHRLMISPQAQLRGRRPDELVSGIVDTVPVPVEG
jgi:MoxR-like ATPase